MSEMEGEGRPEVDPIAAFGELLSRPESLGMAILDSGTGEGGGRNATEGEEHRRRLPLDNLPRGVLLAAVEHLFRRIERVADVHEELSIREKGEKKGKGRRRGRSKQPKDQKPPSSLSGLTELYTGGEGEGGGGGSAGGVAAAVDAETIWGQIELQNQPLRSLIRKSVKKLSKEAADSGGGGNRIKLLDVPDSDAENEEGEAEEGDDSSSGGGEEERGDRLADEKSDGEDGEDDDEDDEARRIRERMERAMADMEDDEGDDDEKPDGDGRPRGKKNEGGGGEEEEEESLVDPAAEELNDGFFDINEMEAFADEEEEYLPDEAYGEENPEPPAEGGGGRLGNKKKSFHQRQRDGEIDDEDDDDDGDDQEEEGDEEGLLFRESRSTIRRRKYREDDEIEALYSLYEKPRGSEPLAGGGAAFSDDDEGDDDGDAINMTAADIFGRPNKKYFDKWKSRGSKSNSRKKDDDDDSWNDYDFNDHDVNENDNTGWGGTDSGSEEKGSEEIAASDGDDSDVDDEEMPMKDGAARDEAGSRSSGKQSPSNGGGQSSRLVLQTEQLEREMLAEKPWQMTGESTSTSRPVNSLLDSTPEFEVATKMAPIVTEKHTADLEDVIKQRILNEDWDDVIPRELPDVGWNLKRGELPEVSQEKSKLGLGELYEREYLKKAVGYDVDAAEKETEEEKAKNEMRSLFAGLCSKLDALSNYHFAPRPVAPEADVKVATKPAIAMEEVLPLHVSDARTSAPEEIYAAKRGRDGVFRGETELEQGDRKRLRSAKKAARRKARKEKLADEKLISRLQPGLGLNNPYEKRKMREELSVARARGKVTTGEVDTNDYGASGTFFKRMQQEAEQAVRGDEHLGKSPDNQPKKSSSGQFKL